MKTTNKKNRLGAYAFALLFLGTAAWSCTDLAEKMHSELDRSTEGGSVDAQDVLYAAYRNLDPLQSYNYWRALLACTDEGIIPDRAGAWGFFFNQSLHMHTMDADNDLIKDAFNEMLKLQFSASNVLRAAGATPQQKAEARFLRALSMYNILSHWGFVPYRENMDNFAILPTTLEAPEAINFIRQELEEAIADLPTFKKLEAWTASKEAAKVLLMKLHLNKAAFLNRENPVFEKADMDRVLVLAAEIRAGAPSLKLSEGAKYYDNFAPINDQISEENIFTLFNHPGVRWGRVHHMALFPTFENMKPGGFGGAGWCTLKSFYHLFEAGDVRRGISYHGYEGDTLKVKVPGKHVNIGFLVGQQYDLEADTALIDPASKRPIIFTEDISIRTEGATNRIVGIRVNKYPYDFRGQKELGRIRNDWAVFRYADVRLMEAEAVLRGGTGGETALAIVNDLRAKRGAPAFTELTLKDEDLAAKKGSLIAERGRELYWENWRREDLVRFGKAREPGDVKDYESAPHTLVFPVPNEQMNVNPNLRQNTGY